MPFEAILFDKDGTLFDFHASWGGWTRGFLLEVSEGDEARARGLGEVIGYDFDSGRFAPGSVVVAGTNADIADLLARELGRADAEWLIGQLAEAALSVPMVEAVALRPLLSGLRARGLSLGLATNDNEAPARAHLEAAGLSDLFDFIAGYDSGHGGKPAPGMLLAFAGAMDIAPENCLMVGDSRHDLVAGRAAGMGTVAVLTGPSPREELEPFADAVLPDIGHLPAWLDAGNGGSAAPPAGKSRKRRNEA